MPAAICFSVLSQGPSAEDVVTELKNRLQQAFQHQSPHTQFVGFPTFEHVFHDVFPNASQPKLQGIFDLFLGENNSTLHWQHFLNDDQLPSVLLSLCGLDHTSSVKNGGNAFDYDSDDLPKSPPHIPLIKCSSEQIPVHDDDLDIVPYRRETV